MINRIQHLFAQSPDPPDRTDYYVVETRAEGIPVSPSTARRILATLEMPETPFWVFFRDIAGASYHLRTDEIHLVRESSARSRARVRAFYRARQREAEEDGNPYGD